ncbi:uncharacterized protein LOC105828138 isoform X3 [Monomorium pharaonis]|uniref:uncharacterized protein LOC105828138 isoform X3 n=1 Tax=Monomorium pharaonis TaxID=307658 RepID=UPI001746B3C3|nr:uncharacterized protein LOC105828138 isoform X3 [Monomorium pharaonis]
MSQKFPTVVTKIDVALKKTESKEQYKKKKQTSSKKMDNTEKMAEKVTETHNAETSQSDETTPKMSVFNKPEDPEVAEISKMTMSEVEFYIKEASQDAEMPKTTSKKSTSSKPGDSDKAEKLCQVCEDTSKIFTSMKLDASKDTKIDQMPKITSEKSTSGKPDESDETKEVLKGMSKKSISTKLEISKDSEVSKMPKTTSEKSASSKPDDSDEIKKELEDMPKKSISTKLEISKDSEVSKMPKTTSEKSASNKPDDSDKAKEVCEMLKDTSRISTSTKLEASKDMEIDQMSKTTSEKSTSIKSDDEATKVCQVVKDTSEKSNSIQLEASKVLEENITKVLKIIPEETTSVFTTYSQFPHAYSTVKFMSKNCKDLQSEVCKEKKFEEVREVSKDTFTSINPENSSIPEVCQMPTTISDTSTSKGNKIEEVRQMCSMSKVSFKPSEILNEFQMCKPVSFQSPSVSTELKNPEAVQLHETSKPTMHTFEYKDEMKSAKNIIDDIEMLTEKFEKNPFKAMMQTIEDVKAEMIPIRQLMPKKSAREINMLQRKCWPPIYAPNLDERPLILATQHLVPSLPIQFFEVFAEMIEAALKKPVVLVHECKINRPITKFVDIAVLPAHENWKDGELLPVSFVFEHYLNKNKSPKVYADVIVGNDRIKNLAGFRGHRCAITENRGQFTAAGALFKELHVKGENLLFFGHLIGQLNIFYLSMYD